MSCCLLASTVIAFLFSKYVLLLRPKICSGIQKSYLEQRAMSLKQVSKATATTSRIRRRPAGRRNRGTPRLDISTRGVERGYGASSLFSERCSTFKMLFWKIPLKITRFACFSNHYNFASFRGWVKNLVSRFMYSSRYVHFRTFLNKWNHIDRGVQVWNQIEKYWRYFPENHIFFLLDFTHGYPYQYDFIYSKSS